VTHNRCCHTAFTRFNTNQAYISMLTHKPWYRHACRFTEKYTIVINNTMYRHVLSTNALY